MNSKVQRLRNEGRLGIWGRGRAASAPDLPLDHRLTYRSRADEEWTFEDGRVFCNGADLRETIREEFRRPGVLSELSHGLAEYQRDVWSREGVGQAKFNGAVAGLQDLVAGRLSSLYDNLTSGVEVEWRGEEFWVNDINVSAALELYRRRPSPEGRHLLVMLQNKLGLILSRRQSSTRGDGISERAGQLFAEISSLLEAAEAHAPLCLGDGRRCA